MCDTTRQSVVFVGLVTFRPRTAYRLLLPTSIHDQQSSFSTGCRHQVLNLCVIAWQAIAAVSSAPEISPASNTDEIVKGLPQGQSAMDVDVEAAAAGTGSAGGAEVQRPSRGGDAAESGSGESGDSDGRASSTASDAFATDPLRSLVRCLCGVVVGRWKQAASITAKAPKKIWVLHAVEAVHALVRTLEVGRYASRRAEGVRWGL